MEFKRCRALLAEGLIEFLNEFGTMLLEFTFWVPGIFLRFTEVTEVCSRRRETTFLVGAVVRLATVIDWIIGWIICLTKLSGWLSGLLVIDFDGRDKLPAERSLIGWNSKLELIRLTELTGDSNGSLARAFNEVGELALLRTPLFIKTENLILPAYTSHLKRRR